MEKHEKAWKESTSTLKKLRDKLNKAKHQTQNKKKIEQSKSLTI